MPAHRGASVCEREREWQGGRGTAFIFYLTDFTAYNYLANGAQGRA